MIYDYTVFIGRFQPFHKGHLYNITKALEISNILIIAIGSVYRISSIKNPFSYFERKLMILSDLQCVNLDLKRIIIVPIIDIMYDKKQWEKEVLLQVYKHVDKNKKIALIGYKKDNSSYYLDYFKSWNFISIEKFFNFNATDFREKLFLYNYIDNSFLINNSNENGTFKRIENFKKTNIFENLKKEFKYVKDYMKKNIVNKKSEFLLILMNNKKILLLNKKKPQKLFYLPGKISDTNNIINNGLEIFFYNLIEELKLPISRSLLKQSFKDFHFLNYEYRTLFNINNVVIAFFNVEDIDLTNIYFNNGNWISVYKILKNMSCFMKDDHYQIISIIIKKYKTLLRENINSTVCN